MLTPPKWQTLWMKFKYSSRSVSNKIMYFKPAEKILDDISNCCGSASKELTLEALSCWRIWIENQLVEDWKQNKTCYFAVRPLLTVKFHPLHRDDEIIETKLCLMWLALHKIQHLMQLEGPQHVLEVFIQSCLSWLSCSEDLQPDIINLILKLLSSLFIKDVEILGKKDSFPPFEASLIQSNKLFTRLLPSFIEIFHNWTRIKEKTDLLCIWNEFLGHCELSFKFIPVSIWHKIFKLVENICGDEKETLEDKLAVLHKCATSLKSVMYNSKFIDCSRLLTTPAEALLKLVIQLSINNTEEIKSFEMFKYCQEICHVLSKRIFETLEYEPFIYILTKIEEINSKSLLWGLWCGLANCFKDEMEHVSFEQYNKIELTVFKKLRSVAVNFDLDRLYLEERSILMIQNQLDFLRIGIGYKDCSMCNGKTVSLALRQGNHYSNFGHGSPVEIAEEEGDSLCRGNFSFDVNNINPEILVCFDRKEPHCLTVFSNDYKRQTRRNTNQEAVSIQTSNLDKIRKLTVHSADLRWLKCNFSRKQFNLHNNLILCHARPYERLIANGYEPRRNFVFSPTCITAMLEEIVKKTRKTSDFSSNNLTENVKKFQNKLNQCQIFTPIQFCVSLKGSNGVKFCRDILRYWKDVEDIVRDVDFATNLKNLISKNDNSILCFCMFAFLVNFTNNLFIEFSENSSCRLNNFYVGEEMVLSTKITDFTEKVVRHKERLSNSDFINNISHILPRNDDNPLVLWSKNNSATKTNKNDKHEKHLLRSAPGEESFSPVHNDDLLIFKYFDELQNKFSNEINSSSNVKKARGRKRKSCFSKTETCRQWTNLKSVDVLPRTVFASGKIWENKKVKVIPAPPDVFRSLKFSELSSEVLPRECKACKERNQTDANYLHDQIQCDACSHSLEDESATSFERKLLSVDEKETSKCDEVNNAEESIVKSNAKRLSSPSRKTKQNLPLSCKEPYFLRLRPLKVPHKFKGENDLTIEKKQRNTVTNKVATTASNTKFNARGSTSGQEKFTNNVDVIQKEDMCSAPVTSPKNRAEGKVEELVDGNEVGTDNNGETCDSICGEESVDVDVAEVVRCIVEAVERYEMNDCEVDISVVKTEVESYPEDEVGFISSPVTTKKRRSSDIDGNVARKKLKLESDICIESTGEVTLKNIETNLDVKESTDSENGLKKVSVDSGNKNSHVVMAQSRGSKMLALIPESPKIERFYNTSPLSKHQAVKPQVNMNSRASKMLALLPEMQEILSNMGRNNVEGSGERVKDESTRKEKRGHIPGKIHHLPRNANDLTSAGSPKRSPMRQRKSIRFDDDKNETLTYFKDSPPCLLRGEHWRRRNK